MVDAVEWVDARVEADAEKEERLNIVAAVVIAGEAEVT